MFLAKAKQMEMEMGMYKDKESRVSIFHPTHS
jgi:hypothetical protein